MKLSSIQQNIFNSIKKESFEQKSCLFEFEQEYVWDFCQSIKMGEIELSRKYNFSQKYNREDLIALEIGNLIQLQSIQKFEDDDLHEKRIYKIVDF
jgi:hypothetical protein